MSKKQILQYVHIIYLYDGNNRIFIAILCSLFHFKWIWFDKIIAWFGEEKKKFLFGIQYYVDENQDSNGTRNKRSYHKHFQNLMKSTILT